MTPHEHVDPTPAAASSPAEPPDLERRGITVVPDGPYLVRGGIPIVVKAPATSEHGEPLTWVRTKRLEARDAYALCRCGGSGTKPFCDGTHARNGFAASGIAEVEPRAADYEGTGITVHDDRAICVHAGFCGNRLTNVWKMVRHTDDSVVRSQVIAMIERCPSGALSYTLEPVEPRQPTPTSRRDRPWRSSRTCRTRSPSSWTVRCG